MPHRIAPDRSPRPAGPLIFLAGSIEQGQAEPWQGEVARQLLTLRPDLVVADPRRGHWDATWPQDPQHPEFAEQVHWELDHLEAADAVLFVFDPATLSPVTLLELGLQLARAPERTVVVCPPTFWRYGNVVLAATRAGVPVYAHRSEGVAALMRVLPD